MQMVIALSLPVVVLLILGILLLLLDIMLSFLMVAILRPRKMPALIKRIVLKSIDFVQKAENQPLPVSQPAAAQADVSIKSTLIDNVNHEIRTPLAGIMATAQILHDEVGPHHQELTELLMQSGQRMDNAISNVLELVTLKESGYQLDLVPIHVKDEIESLIKLHRNQADKKGLDINLAPSPEDFILKTDPQLLRKVLNHLMSNAIKFTEDGSVQLSVKKDDQWLHVAIKDTGIGIKKSILPRLYQPFLQGSHGLTRNHNGQGIGLALTKHMIDLAGGKIRVDSEQGKGSTFTVSYPSK